MSHCLLLLTLLGVLACAPLDAPASTRQQARAAHASPPAVRSPTPLTITVLDLPAPVGGQAVLVSDSSGSRPRHVLIDGSEQEEPLLARLRQLGVAELALVVLSHPHTDHFGGLVGVVRELPVEVFAWTGDTRTLARFRALQQAVDGSAATVLFVTDSPRTVTLAAAADTVHVTLLPPAPHDSNLRGNAINNRSVGVRIRRGGFVALVPGDAEHGQLDWWTRHFRDLLTADVLVASHHGSDDANATVRWPRWYRTVTPSALLVSSNGRQHPYGNVLAFARQQGMTVACTHTNGDISVQVSADGGWRLVTQREHPCTPGAVAPR